MKKTPKIWKFGAIEIRVAKFMGLLSCWAISNLDPRGRFVSHGLQGYAITDTFSYISTANKSPYISQRRFFMLGYFWATLAMESAGCNNDLATLLHLRPECSRRQSHVGVCSLLSLPITHYTTKLWISRLNLTHNSLSDVTQYTFYIIQSLLTPKFITALII